MDREGWPKDAAALRQQLESAMFALDGDSAQNLPGLRQVTDDTLELATATFREQIAARFPDGIAAGNYDIDIHNPEGSGTSHYFFAPGAYYTIPYRCLLPKGTTNLLVAGRCISSTHEAQASYRVMPIVCCIGEAAGVAAGVAHQARVSLRAVDIQRVRALLQAGGAPI